MEQVTDQQLVINQSRLQKQIQIQKRKLNKQWKHKLQAFQTQYKTQLISAQRQIYRLKKYQPKVKSLKNQIQKYENQIQILSQTLYISQRQTIKMSQKITLCHNLQFAFDIAQSQLQHIKKENALLKTDLNQKNQENIIMRQAIHSLEKQLSQKQSQYQKTCQQLSQTLHKFKLNQMNISQLKAKLNQQTQQHIKMNQTKNDLLRLIEQAQLRNIDSYKSIDFLLKTIQQPKRNQILVIELNGRLSEKNQQNIMMKQKIHTLKIKIYQSQQQNFNSVRTIQSLQRTISFLQRTISSLQRTISSLSNNILSLSKTIQELSKKNKISSESQEIQSIFIHENQHQQNYHQQSSHVIHE